MLLFGEALCDELSEILQLVGWVLLVFKIAIPLLIVALGAFDFGKAVTAGKDEEIKKSAKTLMYRAIAGIIIFFVPTIVLWLFGLISGYNNEIANAGQSNGEFSINYDNCKGCLLHPGNSGECSVTKSSSNY